MGRWSLVLVCVLLLLAVSEGRKKKPSKGKKPGKKPSKPGVKGECDVGSPKLTVGNTKKYTGSGKCACWWDITRNDCACCKKGVNAMQCGFPMHKFCYKKSDMGCPGVCNYKYTLSGKGYPCFSDHSNTDCAWCNKNGWQCEQNSITGPDSKKGSRCQASEPHPKVSQSIKVSSLKIDHYFDVMLRDQPEVLRVSARRLQ